MGTPFERATITWRDGRPFAPAYGDGYFSRVDPEGERRAVFFDGNDLARRLPGADGFLIAETGFGTGLNLLTVLHSFTAHPWRRLTYVAWEKHPIDVTDLEEIHALWPALTEPAAALRAAYPPMVPGVHHLTIPRYALTLILIFDEVGSRLDVLPGGVDAWFLDGFAPGTNPDMWTPELFAAAVRHAAPGATAASYSVAGVVRRGLEAAGFVVRRAPGFGGKRHMLRAHIPHAASRTEEVHPSALPHVQHEEQAGTGGHVPHAPA